MTLQLLRTFGRQEGLTGFLDEITDQLEGAAQAVCLSYDSYWLSVTLANLTRYYAHEYWPPGHEYWWLNQRSARLAVPDYDKLFADAVNTYRPSDWGTYCRTRGYSEGASPVLIKIILRRPAPPRELPDTWQGYPILYLLQPPIHAYAQAISTGDNLGQATPDTLGTLGGVLQHRDGTLYIATAGHVLPQQGDVFLPSPTRRKRPPRIAFYRAGKYGNPFAKCNSRFALKASDVDIALCTLDPNAVTLPAPLNAGIARWSPVAEMSQGDPVAFCGARTHHGLAEIAGTTLWCEVDVDGQMLCYGDCFSIRPRHKVYINTPLAKPGDSGAWIVYDGNDPLRALDGTLIGGVGSDIYCSYAENIKNWCDNQFGVDSIRFP
jgi:hypothetical protein